MDKITQIHNAFSAIRITIFAREFKTKNDETILCIYNTEEDRDKAKKPNKEEEVQIYSHRDVWMYKIRTIDNELEREETEFDSFKDALLYLATDVISQILENIIFSEEIIDEIQENIPIDKNGNCLN